MLAGNLEMGFGPASGQSAVLGCVGPHLLVRPDGGLPSLEELAELGPPEERIAIGRIGEQEITLWTWPAATQFPPWLRKGHYRTLWGNYPDGVLDAANRAIQLAAWLAEHRYCGACGHGLETQSTEPGRRCGACGSVAYPRISPVAIVLVLRGREMLLGRSPHFQPGMYSALAGFVEAGESLEDCAAREVREEVGVEIANLRWFGSQSWSYPHSLMMGFIADYAGGEIRPQAGEIEDAGWFSFDALPVLPHPASIAARMIRAVLEGTRPA